MIRVEGDGTKLFPVSDNGFLGENLVQSNLAL
jgi:hypothetical protein